MPFKKHSQTSVVQEGASCRLDQYLVKAGFVMSRSQGARWIKEGLVLLNGNKVRSSLAVKPGDQLEIFAEPVQKTHLTPFALPLSILDEDDHLIVINKPVDLVVHPGAGHQEQTLTHALLAHCGGLSQIGGVERPGIVHRLDKGTSGCLVVAKNDYVHGALSDQFKKHHIQKIYLALVYGRFKNPQGTIQTRMGRSPHHRKKMAVLRQGGREAITHYQVLGWAQGVSFVKIILQTGRTHQIRVHMAHQGHGLVGDLLYGSHDKQAKQMKGEIKQKAMPLKHPLLHAWKLGFDHPVTHQAKVYKAPLAEDFKQFLECLFGPDWDSLLRTDS